MLRRALGLGLVVGAVLPHAIAAQVPDSTRARPRPDSVRVAIPAAPADTTRRDSSVVPLPAPAASDTVKPPLARASMPVPIGIGPAYRWNFDSLLTTGAMTLQDVLDRIPGVTGLRAGWIAAPMVSAYAGEPTRVRLFLDGVELDELDPRAGGAFDLTQIPIWALEELLVERGASELRIYMRSWSVERTTPYTRTDVATGDQQTNLYRGYFGRRFGRGEALQIGAQQYGTSPGRSLPSSDQLGLLGRVGWASRRWSIDAFAFRASRHRGTVISQTQAGFEIPGVDSKRTDAYLRVGGGNVDAGPWVQAIASYSNYDFTGRAAPATGTEEPPSADTSRFRAQYVLTGGLTWYGLRLTGAERVRIYDGETVQTPSLRAGFESGPLALDAFLEGKGPDSVARGEIGVRLTPLPFLSLSATASRRIDDRLTGDARNSDALRAEGGVRLGRLWLAGGVIRRDSTVLLPPTIFADTAAERTLVPVAEPSRVGTYASIRGTIVGALKADITAMRWNDTAGFYRPQFQTRSEVYLQTNWLSKFPSGNFGFLFSAVHEYRSNVHFPTAAGVSTAIGSRSIATLLEIRILQAVLSWQFRNVMGDRYEYLPGFQLPRQTQFYGVRWEFWN